MKRSSTPNLAFNFPAPAAGRGREALRIALINNLPDAAMRNTEWQFCTLLRAASDGLTVTLDVYTFSGMPRGREARTHIATYYKDIADLPYHRPDGIIVTGSEPKANCLEQEPFWDELTGLYDFAREQSIPVIWSCLAAHAAVYYGGGPPRVKLSTKLSGVFDSRVRTRAHDLLRGLPHRWRMPQSRLNGLSERLLADCGYEIVARSRVTGPDIFLRYEPALQVFLQSHPEYSSGALPAEFRRDVRLFLLGERDRFPTVPANVFPSWARRRLVQLGMTARAGDAGLLQMVDAVLASTSPGDDWSAPACRFFSNWLTLVSEQAAGFAPPPAWAALPPVRAPERVPTVAEAGE